MLVCPAISIWIRSRGAVARVEDLLGNDARVILASEQIEHVAGISSRFGRPSAAKFGRLTPIWPKRR